MEGEKKPNKLNINLAKQMNCFVVKVDEILY